MGTEFLLHYVCSLHAFTSPEEVSYRLSDTDMYTLIKGSPKTRDNNFRHRGILELKSKLSPVFTYNLMWICSEICHLF